MSKSLRSLISFYPVLSAGVVQAALAFVVAAGLTLTQKETGSIEAAAAAALALLAGWKARPFQVPLLTGALTALGTLLVTFGVPHLTSGEVSTFNLLIGAVLAALTHSSVSSVAYLRGPRGAQAAGVPPSSGPAGPAPVA